MRRMQDMRRPNYLNDFGFLTHSPAISYVAFFDIQVSDASKRQYGG